MVLALNWTVISAFIIGAAGMILLLPFTRKSPALLQKQLSDAQSNLAAKTRELGRANAKLAEQTQQQRNATSGANKQKVSDLKTISDLRGYEWVANLDKPIYDAVRNLAAGGNPYTFMRAIVTIIGPVGPRSVFPSAPTPRIPPSSNVSRFTRSSSAPQTPRGPRST